VSAPEKDVDDVDLVSSWDAIVLGYTRTQRRLLASIEAAENLPGPSFEALRLLLGSPDRRMPLSRLARDLAMTAGGLTKLADRLARDGLIDRRNSSDDRRVVYAALTDKGSDLALRTLDLYRAGLREHVLGALSPSQLTDLAEAMQTLGAVHDVDEAGEAAAAEALLTARDPALPERRQRDRT
jgi:DNA-binding MarR family transcriptional regulator